MKKPAAKLKKASSDKSQSLAFIEKAREIGADGESSRAEELMGRLAKMPPEPKQKIVNQ
jgi:hypothetical protein